MENAIFGAFVVGAIMGIKTGFWFGVAFAGKFLDAGPRDG